MAEDYTDLDREAERHRTDLSRTLGRLIDAVDPARNGNAVVTNATAIGHDAVDALTRAAKANPVGVALVGAGALMLLSGGTKPRSGATPPATLLDGEGFDDRLRAADQAQQRMASVDATSAYAADSGPSASRLEALLDAGLDKLGPKSRERVITARRKAVEAQRDVERHAARLKAQAERMHHDQPLTTGALAIGLGALIGALLPSTRRETELMGASRDRFFREAESILHEELDGLKQRASGAVDSGVAGVKQGFATAQAR